MGKKNEQLEAPVITEDLEALKAKLDEAEALATAQSEEIEALKAKLDEADELILSRNAKLEETKAKLADAEAKLAGGKFVAKEKFEFNGATYEVLGPALIPGKGKLTALEISTDAETQAYLVGVRSGVIREVK